jgi:hypothetical protein
MPARLGTAVKLAGTGLAVTLAIGAASYGAFERRAGAGCTDGYDSLQVSQAGRRGGRPPRARRDCLKADAGGNRVIRRGADPKLDASGSTGAIDEYRWRFFPGPNCPPGLPNDWRAKGKTPSVHLLCTMNVGLMVEDADGERAFDRATITVEPRAWSTPVVHTGHAFDTENVRLWIVPGLGHRFAENISDCPGARHDDFTEIFCPLLKRGEGGDPSWRDRGYELERLPRGPRGTPFRGWYYPVKPSIEIRRRAIYNPLIAPGSPTTYGPAGENWWQHNLNAGTDVDGFLANLIQHEGEGRPGLARSGHTSAVREYIQADVQNDPRKEIERWMGTDDDKVAKKIDARLLGLQGEIRDHSADHGPGTRPLAIIWAGDLELWNGSAWYRSPETVGGVDPGR